MSLGRLVALRLRTTDVDAAVRFYRDVLGWTPAAEALPARALARGARAHWLGCVGVAAVAAAVARLLARGAQRLGPPPSGSETFAIARSPQGATLGIVDGAAAVAGADAMARVAWHELHVPDLDAGWSYHGELLDWRPSGTLALDGELAARVGTYRTFAWRDGDRSVGGLASNARRPEVHAQWLHYLAVADLDRATARVRELGGLVIGPWTRPDGVRVAVGDDPQGGAFALWQAA